MLVAASVFAQQDERAQDLFQQHRWFDLKGVPVADRYASALIDGALASAFNRPGEAERQLKDAVRLAKGTEQINTAREKLLVLYLRQNRTREATKQMEAALKRDPSRSDMRAMLDLVGPVAGYPPFTVRRPKNLPSPISCEVTDSGVWFAVLGNGHKVSWLLDTGANFSFMSESEAKSLGVVMHRGVGAMHDFAGGDAQAKIGVMERLTIGGFELRSLPVLIFPDNRPPFDKWAPSRRGVIGLTAAIALDALSWTRSGVCDAGFSLNSKSKANLAFDDLSPVVRATLDSKPIEFLLDTGNQAGTQLWTRFKADFAQAVAAPGVSFGTEHIVQPGGSNDRPATLIPQLKFDVGGLGAVLKPAKLFAKPVGNDYHHGLLGMDVFSQAREITLDFRNMTFTAR